MFAIPRSAILALWGRAVVEGGARIDDAVSAVTGDDDRHRLTGADLPFSAHPDGPGVGDWLDQLSATDIRVVMPAPGDVLGVPGGPTVTEPATEAGEAVISITEGLGSPTVQVLIPQLTSYGSDLEPGMAVVWSCYRAERPPPPLTDDPVSADRLVRAALVQAVDRLTDAEVARWRPELADALHLLRSTALPTRLFPPGCPPPVIRLVDSAVRLLGLIRLAREQAEPGTDLTDLDRAARRALVAACSTPPR